MTKRIAVFCLLSVPTLGCGSADPDTGPRSVTGPDPMPTSGGEISMPDGVMMVAGDGVVPPVMGANDPAGMPTTMVPTDMPAAPMGTVEPPQTGMPEDPTTVEPPDGEMEPPMAWDECGLDTGFAGDDRCILPPPPDQGFQVHVGPDDYDNPDSAYMLMAGEERTDNFTVTLTNEEDAFFYYRQYRFRPTAHHVILTTGESTVSGFDGGRRIGTANTSLDFPRGGEIPPEDQGVGIPISAHSSINVSLHAINVFEEPEIREIWVNFWYRDPAEVTEPAEQIFEIGDATFAIQPNEETTLGPYTCEIENDGRMLWLYGHRHANNERFTVWRTRGTQRDLIYEGYDWEEPLLLEYNSITENPPVNRDLGLEGGWSGILDLQAGDKLEWECFVANHTTSILRFTNNTYTGEMCIVDAEAVGTDCVSSQSPF